jgi:hypothetical protein
VDLQLICPIASGAMSPFQMLVHAGLTTVVVSSGSVLLALAVRTYRRTAPRPPVAEPERTPGIANPRPVPGVRSSRSRRSTI